MSYVDFMTLIGYFLHCKQANTIQECKTPLFDPSVLLIYHGTLFLVYTKVFWAILEMISCRDCRQIARLIRPN